MAFFQAFLRRPSLLTFHLLHFFFWPLMPIPIPIPCPVPWLPILICPKPIHWTGFLTSQRQETARTWALKLTKIIIYDLDLSWLILKIWSWLILIYIDFFDIENNQSYACLFSIFNPAWSGLIKIDFFQSRILRVMLIHDASSASQGRHYAQEGVLVMMAYDKFHQTDLPHEMEPTKRHRGMVVWLTSSYCIWSQGEANVYTPRVMERHWLWLEEWSQRRFAW